MSRSHRTVPLSALCVLALLGGCGGQVIAAGEVSVLVAQRTGSGMEALGGGRIEVVGGCLGASGSVILWPHGTDVLDEDPLAIRVPGYDTYALGDDVQIAGGYVLEHEESPDVGAGPYRVGGLTVPAECAKHDIFLAH